MGPALRNGAGSVGARLRLSAIGLMLLGLCACDTAPPAPAVVAGYQQLAQAALRDSRAGVEELQRAVERLQAQPGPITLQNARTAWARSKYAYSVVEAFRFGHWPMEAFDIRVNSWPIDEGLIDYVNEPYVVAPENPLGRANLVAAETLNLSGRTLNVSALSGGLIQGFHALAPVESAVLSGFHAVEFLLWGQDLNPDGAGQRPWTDYATGPDICTDGPAQPAPLLHCQRRRQLLAATTQLLVQDLIEMQRVWADDAGSYGSRLSRSAPQAGLRQVFFAIVSLASDELAGERLAVPLQSSGQEDEQDCFSDLTTRSIAGNIAGIAAVYRGRYTGQDGQQIRVPALRALIAHRDAALRDNLDASLTRIQALSQAMETTARAGLPFDQQISASQPAARARIRELITSLQYFADELSRGAVQLGLGPLNPAMLSATDTGGGATTTARLSPDVVLSPGALSQPAANLSPRERARFAVGNSFFTTPWVAAPASTTHRDGLGPLFNAAACQNCHIRDGRGHAPTGPEDDLVSSVVRLGDTEGRPDPIYGMQIQDGALPGHTPEARVTVHWDALEETLADGSRITLRRPRLELRRPAFGLLAPGTHLGLRVAPPMTGLGLLELIPAARIRQLADPDDADHDGISGRVRELPGGQLGRFGWKAAQPSIPHQAASAFSQDMGLTTAQLPAPNCPQASTSCRDALQGGEPEVDADVLAEVSFYARHLAVPQRRWTETAEVVAGDGLFHQIGCARCHTPAWVTDSSAEFPALSAQTIRPYTDMLLHDMGPGLADGVGEPGVLPGEWRTPPLWGLHLAKAVGGSDAGYLHDGRALSLEAAILWHGGEGQAAADAFRQLPRSQRDNLIWFLKSL